MPLSLPLSLTLSSLPHSVLTPSLCPHFLSSAPQVFYVAEDALLAITLQRVEDALPAVRQRKETTTLPRDASLFPQSVLILCRPHFALILEAERSRNRIGTLLACVCQPPSCIVTFLFYAHSVLARSSFCPHFESPMATNTTVSAHCTCETQISALAPSLSKRFSTHMNAPTTKA